MNAVLDIFDAFGGPTAIANATGFSVKTVCDWRVKGEPEIPPWRRPAVLEAARRTGVMLPDHCVTYLASLDRNVRQANAA